MNFQQYNDNAGSIRTRDIATNSNNRIVLRRIKRNSRYDENNGVLYIQNVHDAKGEDCIDYVPEGANDMGWLGYFVGRNNHLEELCIDFEAEDEQRLNGVEMDVLRPFLLGVNNNRSITSLGFNSIDTFGGRVFSTLGPFFKNNNYLTSIRISQTDFEAGGCRALALALVSCTNSSLEILELRSNVNISDMGMVDIITALSIHPNLKTLHMEDTNSLNTNGCKALSTLLKCSVPKLRTLDLSNNELDDERIDALVPGLKSCISLQKLTLVLNPSITTRGLQNLAPILEAPNSSLISLYTLGSSSADDQVVHSFASSLANNHTLQTLGVSTNSITERGWEAFSKLLCNTSSVNATFLSNHTLQHVSILSSYRPQFGPLFELNQRKDKKEVAMIKILQNHNDINMTSFFEWEFKVLPLMINWFERASPIMMPENFESSIGPRKLLSIYQFVRGMPLLYVETRLRKELEDIKSKESKMEEKQQELEEELLELEAKHQSIQEKKAIIMKQLGR